MPWAAAVTAAGGTVVMAGMDVGDQGRMAVFQDPTGAFISVVAVECDDRLPGRGCGGIRVG